MFLTERIAEATGYAFVYQNLQQNNQYVSCTYLCTKKVSMKEVAT